MYPIYPMSHVYKKPGLLGYSRTTSPKYISYPWFLAEMTIIHLPTEWKIWYRLRTTYMVSVSLETMAPCRITCHCRLSVHVKQWNSCVRKYLALFHQKYGHLTVRTLTRPIWELHVGVHVQEANMWHGSAETATGGSLGLLRIDYCRKATDQRRKQIRDCVKTKEQHFNICCDLQCCTLF